MRIEITTENDEAKMDYMRKLLQIFIETKMKTYGESERNSAAREPEKDISKIKYLASLWMVFSVIGIMQREEIAEQLGISYDLLQSWHDDSTFKALVQYNYKEWLICIAELYA